MSFTSFAAKPLRTREEIARDVHAVSLRRGLDELATVIALMTISTEVGAADANGNRQWWCPANPTNDSETAQFEHDSTSDDSRSSGYFQQQPGPNGEAWWGTAKQRMTLAEAAEMFLGRLSNDYRNSRDAHSAGVFAQLVQGSAFPDRYREKWDECHEVLARALAGNAAAPGMVAKKKVGWAGDPVWLEEVLRPVLGDKLKTLAGWESHGHGNFGDIWGVLWHHTGNANATAESIRDGRPDLAGPVSNLHIAPDGTVSVVAVGVCWHAGAGCYNGLPTNCANDRLIGIECAWPTIRRDGSYDAAERWPDAQIISMRDVAAALTNKLGYGPERNISHKEWASSAQGKWDPGNIDMNWFRGEVAKAMRGEFSKPVVVVPAAPIEAPRLPAPPIPRTDRVLLEDIWTQLCGPGGHGWPQLGNKTLVDYVADLGMYAADLNRNIAELRAMQESAKPKKRPAKKAPAKKAPAKKAPAKKTL
jgi:N-acetylmuramoyl-L-alanine amidase